VRGIVAAAIVAEMSSIWRGVLVALMLGSSTVAVAEDAKPKPSVEMSLAERGLCSVTECGPIKRPQRDITGRDRWRHRLRHNDPHRPDWLLRLHREYAEALRYQQHRLDEINALLAACETAER
jgi:hypothetical protein